MRALARAGSSIVAARAHRVLQPHLLRAPARSPPSGRLAPFGRRYLRAEPHHGVVSVCAVASRPVTGDDYRACGTLSFWKAGRAGRAGARGVMVPRGRGGRARRARTRASGWCGQGAHLGGASCEEHGERVDVVARERPRPASAPSQAFTLHGCGGVPPAFSWAVSFLDWEGLA